MNTLQIDTLNVNIVQSMRAAAGKGAPKASPGGRARPRRAPAGGRALGPGAVKGRARASRCWRGGLVSRQLL